MNSQRNVVWLVLVLVPSVVAVVALAIAGGMYQRVRAFNARYQCDVLAGLPAAGQELKSSQAVAPQPDATTNCVVRAKPTAVAADSAPTTNVVKRILRAVDRVDYDGDMTLDVRFNFRLDADVIKDYVSVEPLIEGQPCFRYEARCDRRNKTCEPRVQITGEYAHRTNVTLKIRKGFPLYDKETGKVAEGTLTNDFVYVFRRNDPDPSVTFDDNGRYLPPGGRKVLRLEAVGMTNIATEIRRVEPRNVVQLLAREEGVYRRGRWWRTVDNEDTAELSGGCETGVVRCVNRPCEKEICHLPVVMRDGGREHGVFLVAVRNGDIPRNECEWNDERYNPNCYRLVCLSDLGLSVRRSKDDVGVWVTSLMTGKPVVSACVEVYSSANILLAQGETDENGWCVPKRCAAGEPFAVVVLTESDMSFLALADSMKVDETYDSGARPAYLEASEADAFVWTERGIYRHGEPMFAHVIVRNGSLAAPAALPLVLALKDPKGRTTATKTLVTDADGTLAYDGFRVAAEQPSGKWTVEVRLPGPAGKVLAEREVKVEEFAPPQIRVTVAADGARHPTNFAFKVAAEHLFGGPASSLACEGAVVFEDEPFAPKQWKGFVFGNDQRGFKPNFRRLSEQVLDARGEGVFDAPLLEEDGLPKAAVRIIGQGVVFEDGGRPATARKTVVCHYYPYYIGANMPDWLKKPKGGAPKVDLVCVDPEGEPVAGPRRLLAKIERIDSVYSYRKKDDGQSVWDCERIRTTLFDRIALTTDASGKATYVLPMKECGDYVLTVEDPDGGASFGRAFYLSDWGDDVVRAPLANPTKVSISTDKPFYRVGESPRLVIKAPFAGYAQVAVLRGDLVYAEILNLTNTTSEIVLRPVERAWAPNVDVSVSVVQSVAANARHLAARARGLTTVCVRPVENEIDVRLKAAVAISEGGSTGPSHPRVTVELEADRATSAVVTLVDEGINLLTGEPTPNPRAWFGRPRTGDRPMFDLFDRILPVVDDGLRTGGVKTGGGCGADMLGRVSPVPTRRFKPLVLWQEKVPITGGRGRAVFELPEFVGEVRVTAVAWSATATGAASVQKKVAPKLILQPDAPRFVAPGDKFDATMTVRNSSEADGDVNFSFDGGCGAARQGTFTLGKGASTNLVFSGCEGRPSDGSLTGTMNLVFAASGLGERHEAKIELPVRPAVAWRGRTDVVRLDPGERLQRTAEGVAHRYSVSVGASPMAELASALEWLADYPHGCLEQTTSRMFPLVTAGGILNAVASKAAAGREGYLEAGVRRVESMIRENDFVMWPDCSYAPWDREVSIYAAQFLIEAGKAGLRTDPAAKAKVLRFLKKWALSENDGESAYACLVLALAGEAERDRMFRLYDRRTELGALSRARLARAFASIHDRTRAEELLKFALEPQSVKEASFLVQALLELDPDDARITSLIDYLNAQRDRQRFSWGTTAENAHALLAIGAYYRRHPAKDGDVKVSRCGEDGTLVGSALGKRDRLIAEGNGLSVTNMGSGTAFLTVRETWLGDPKDEIGEANGLFLSRRYLRPDGTPADLTRLTRGEMLVAELTITTDVTRVVGDLVIEDLFAGAFEPVHRELSPSAFATAASADRLVKDWVMRTDARDDRMLVFSKRFELEKDHEAKVLYPVRVVSAGDFVLPGPSVEGMYHPALRARLAPGRLVVRP